MRFALTLSLEVRPAQYNPILPVALAIGHILSHLCWLLVAEKLAPMTVNQLKVLSCAEKLVDLHCAAELLSEEGTKLSQLLVEPGQYRQKLPF